MVILHNMTIAYQNAKATTDHTHGDIGTFSDLRVGAIGVPVDEFFHPLSHLVHHHTSL